MTTPPQLTPPPPPPRVVHLLPPAAAAATIMFWGLIVEPGKRYTKTVVNPFHISAAVLDTSALDDELVRVMVEVDDCEVLIANLSLEHGILQSQLDLQFESGSHVAFYTTGGKSPVHLSGYVIFDDEVYGEDEEEKESTDEDLSPIEPSATIRTKTDDKVVKNKIKYKREIKCKIADKATLKRKTVDTLASPLKKVKIAEELEHFANDNIHVNADTSDDDSEEEDGDLSAEELHSVFPGVERMEDEVKLDGEDKEEDTSAELHNTQTLGTEVPILKDEKTHSPKKKTRMIETQALGAGASTPKSKKSPKAEKKNPITKAQTPRADEPALKSEKTPKYEKKVPLSGAQTPKAEDKTPKKKSPKLIENLAKDMGKSKSPQGTPQAASKSAKVVKAGGVTCEDLVVGTGPEAKCGKMVSVYYEGRLLNNKKMFDKCDSGKGLKFWLGSKEVISGWDVGVAGMKVGGKRRIICPPHMAYGKKGVPGIPPHSTLMFVVELKAVH